MKTKVEDLREHLFWALEGLKDGTLSIDSAKAMADIGTVIVNSIHRCGPRSSRLTR